jgi:DNA-binding beta-propeller fold protein YncE
MRQMKAFMLGVGLAAIAGYALAAANNAAPNPYKEEMGWAKNGAGRNFGSTIGLAMDPDGKSIWVFDRCGGNTCEGSNIDPITKYDASGSVVKTLGAKMFVRPHGFTVDKDGNLWTVDGAGTPPRGNNPGKGHTVTKMDQNGKVLMTLGTPGVTGEDPAHFNAPADVVIAANGDIFVADGHGDKTNGRIVRFDKDGKFIKAWGKPGTGPGEFDEPHGLAMDSQGRLFVADRANNRIQIFDAEGKLLDTWKQFGRPSGIAIDASDTLYVADSQSDEKVNPGFGQGVRIGNAKTGEVVNYIPETRNLGSMEAVAADGAGHVWAGYTGAMNFKRFGK